MRKSILIFILSMVIIASTALVAFATSVHYTYTNNSATGYGYSPVGDRIVMAAATNTGTKSKTYVTLKSLASVPARQYLYGYVARRQYETVLEANSVYKSVVRGAQIYTSEINRYYNVASYNMYHEAKCFDYTSYTLNPSEGMTNLYEEFAVRINQ